MLELARRKNTFVAVSSPKQQGEYESYFINEDLHKHPVILGGSIDAPPATNYAITISYK